jgi:hypothetical protein
MEASAVNVITQHLIHFRHWWRILLSRPTLTASVMSAGSLSLFALNVTTIDPHIVTCPISSRVDDYFALFAFHRLDTEFVRQVVQSLDTKCPLGLAEFLCSRIGADHPDTTEVLRLLCSKNLSREMLGLLAECNSFDLQLIKDPIFDLVSRTHHI